MGCAREATWLVPARLPGWARLPSCLPASLPEQGVDVLRVDVSPAYGYMTSASLVSSSRTGDSITIQVH